MMESVVIHLTKNNKTQSQVGFCCSYTKGGSSGEGSTGNPLDPNSFGTNKSGYTTGGFSLAPKGRFSVGAVYSSGYTW